MSNYMKDGIDSKLFAERIKDARGSMSREELADKALISTESIKRYEEAFKGDGKGRIPSIGKAASIAKATGVSLNWLAGLSNIKELHKEGAEGIILESYGDVYSVLKRILDIFMDSHMEVKSSRYMEVDYTSGYPEERERKEIHISIPDEDFVGFMDAMESVKSFTVSDDVRKTILSSLLKNMDDKQLPWHYDDGLPF